VKFADLLADRDGVCAGLKQGVLIGVAVLTVTLQPSGSATSRLASRSAPPALVSAEPRRGETSAQFCQRSRPTAKCNPGNEQHATEKLETQAEPW